MQTVIEAVYENGVLRPLDSLALEEHHHYRLVVETASQSTLQQPIQRKASKALDRTRETAWLREHRHQYSGQYVALAGDTLLAHGPDGKTVLAEAEATGEPLPYLARIEDADETAVWGGWL